jgi:hypothetical protein
LSSSLLLCESFCKVWLFIFGLLLFF